MPFEKSIHNKPVTTGTKKQNSFVFDNSSKYSCRTLYLKKKKKHEFSIIPKVDVEKCQLKYIYMKNVNGKKNTTSHINSSMYKY